MSQGDIKGSILTFDSIKDSYPTSKYILLMPQVSRHMLDLAPMWSLDVATIKLDPNNKHHAYFQAGSGGFSLTKFSIGELAKLADASAMTKRIDVRTNRMYAEYEAYAVMTTSSGGVRGQSRTCAWEGHVETQQVRREAKAFIDKMVTESDRKPTAEQYKDAVEDRYEEQWIREQRYGKRCAETAAANRALRVLLGIQDTYSKSDLADKEFAVMRFVFTPDCGDPEIKKLVVGRYMDAQRMLYPSPGTQQEVAGSSPALLPEEQPCQIDEAQEADLLLAGEIHQEPEPEPLVDVLEWSQVAGYIPGLIVAISRAKPALNAKLSEKLSAAMEKSDPEAIAQIVDYCETSGLTEEPK